MQSRAVSVLITAFFVALAQRLDAQIIYPSGSVPSRFSFGGDVVISQPKGEFANNVPTGYGFDLTGMFRLDPRGYFNIRADLGGVQYGRETQRVNFPNTGRVSLDVETRQSDRLRFDRRAAPDSRRLVPSLRECSIRPDVFLD